jgi:hypothetical protein
MCSWYQSPFFEKITLHTQNFTDSLLMSPIQKESVKSKKNNQDCFFFARVTNCKQMFKKEV